MWDFPWIVSGCPKITGLPFYPECSNMGLPVSSMNHLQFLLYQMILSSFWGLSFSYGWFLQVLLVSVHIPKGCTNNKEDIAVEITANKKIMLTMSSSVLIALSEAWGLMLTKICRRTYLTIIYNIWINVWPVSVFYSNSCLSSTDESSTGLFYQLTESLSQSEISLENNDVHARIVVWTFLKSQLSFFVATHLLDVWLLNILLKPWPNRVASRRKLKTWVILRLHLARPCMHLRWLAITLVVIKFACKSKQFFHRLATQT